LILSLGILPAACAARKVRPCAEAGRWYPSSCAALAGMIDGFLKEAKGTPPPGRPVALIAPHAGYTYSGPTAASAYAAVAGRRYARVVLLAFSHSVYIPGISLPDVAAYRTPLGDVPLDAEACAALRALKAFRAVPAAHAREHSEGNQLPFLQKVLLPGWKLVPVLVGRLDDARRKEVVAALKALGGPDTLYVASTDFTHYGAAYAFVPFRKDIRLNIHKLDHGALARILALDPHGFTQYCARTRATICGRKPVALLLRVLPPASRGRVVHYTLSGDRNRDYTTSVSYAAVVFAIPDKASEAAHGKKEGTKMEASSAPGKAEQRVLLDIAWRIVKGRVRGERPEAPKASDPGVTKRLQQHAGAFVTLTNKGRLRGCIGYTMPVMPLYMAVAGGAAGAARDPRFTFQRITPAELKQLSLEISVLSPPRKVEGPDAIVIGTHGIIIEKDGRTAVYLPKVPVEQGWNREQTLTHLCRKAGLTENAWKKGMTFKVFEAHVFGEDHPD
jgi:AmmeMemoRadiSam system protein B/AmmeMemoRadiSam system protein A